MNKDSIQKIYKDTEYILDQTERMKKINEKLNEIMKGL